MPPFLFDFKDLDNHDGVVTQLELDILEYEVKWALESIGENNACGGNGIPAELFKILKDVIVKVLHSIMSANLGNVAMVTGLKEVNFPSNLKEGQCQRMFKLL